MIPRSEYDPRLFHGIAHRGYHDEISPENSLSAFHKAIEANLPFECDVHLTKDGEILICHDGDLQRMTGIPGKIEELTLAEIRGKYKLPDGSDLPLLKEALELCQERVPIVVELKVVNANYKPLAEKTLALLEGIQNKKNITIISFDPRALKSCKKKGFSLGLLIEKNNTWVLMFRGFFDYLDIEDCLVNDKRVLSYRKKGRLVNVWTIDTKEKLDYIRGKVDMITFQHLPLKDVEDAHAR
jgi:glycerophosphoryl diester phosphodiesterase